MIIWCIWKEIQWAISVNVICLSTKLSKCCQCAKKV